MLRVDITGTGMPRPAAGRAGPGVLVRADEVALQIDAGRATVLRLAELGVACADLAALLVTHHHSDHIMGVTDLAMSRWFEGAQMKPAPLPVTAPRGDVGRILTRLLEPWEPDLAVRTADANNDIRPEIQMTEFEASPTPQEVWWAGDVRVSSVSVHHEPVLPAVAYRVDSPDGAVVVSGDTVVCDEVRDLAMGADVLVHSAVSRAAVRGLPYEWVVEYHADSVGVGRIAAEAGVKVLVLTHLLPEPANETVRNQFVQDVREGGFDGELIVANDLDAVIVEGDDYRVELAED